MNRTIRVVAGWLVLAAGVAGADVRVAKIFTDNMVLQQELPIAVWGWAEAGEQVTVSLTPRPGSGQAGKSASAKAGDDGKWRVDLPAMKADGKARTLRVKGKTTITLKNVLLGEVWLCAGQSNMNRGVNVKESHPNIRLFWIDGSTVPMKDDLGEGVAGWVESTPKAVAAATPPKRGRFAGKPRRSFTEVGYVFGRKIHEELKVPVGLIKCAFGGSNVGAWTPKPGIEKEYPFGQEVKKGYVGHTPGLLYQSMVRGIVPLTIRGVIWYQGENDGRNRNYHTGMKTWIAGWRKLWGRDRLPFYLVQIAPTTYAGGKMQYVWQSQVWVMHNVPHTALAVSNDILPDTKVKVDAKTGFPKTGGGNPHPPNKHIVAGRLANIALVRTYGRPDRVLFGPMYASHKISGPKVVVTFKYVGGGLATRDGKAPNWFELSDGTKERRNVIYVPAKAEIAGKDTVVVSSPDVKQPKFVRFGWNCEARLNLMNKEGLPAVSFQTDEPLKGGSEK